MKPQITTAAAHDTGRANSASKELRHEAADHLAEYAEPATRVVSFKGAAA